MDMDIRNDREYKNSLKIFAEAKLSILAEYNALKNNVSPEQLKRALGPAQCWALGIEDDLRAFEKERGL